jgi:DNA-binding NarL/FixJ family response regulator
MRLRTVTPVARTPAYRSPAAIIRVLIAEDSYLVREGIQRVVEAEPDLEVAGVCGDLRSLLDAVESCHPDVVVTDVRMPPDNTDEGIQAATYLRRRHPDLAVLVLSQHDEPEYTIKLLEAGARSRGYLLKDRILDPVQLVAAIREVAAGGSVIDEQVVESLVQARSKRKRSPLSQLSGREREVLFEMAQGRNNQAIAATLHITLAGVEKHINLIFSKLGLTGEVEIHRRVTAVLMFLTDLS